LCFTGEGEPGIFQRPLALEPGDGFDRMKFTGTVGHLVPGRVFSGQGLPLTLGHLVLRDEKGTENDLVNRRFAPAPIIVEVVF